jgi:hypothetical protein
MGQESMLAQLQQMYLLSLSQQAGLFGMQRIPEQQFRSSAFQPHTYQNAQP